MAIVMSLEAVIQHLRGQQILTDLVDDRIAAKHRYSDGWDRGQTSIVVRLDLGTPELYVEDQRNNLEARCYGSSMYEAVRMANGLIEVTRASYRQTVDLADGSRALLYWLHPVSQPVANWDPDVEMDFASIILESLVAETALA